MAAQDRFRVLVLASVSSRTQAKRRRRQGEQVVDEEKFSIPSQLATCQRLIDLHPSWVKVGEIVIPGHSRRYDWLHDLVRDCPEYADMIGRIDRHECDGLLMAFYDRAFRSTTLAPQLAVYCAERGVQLRAADRFQEFLPPAEFTGLSPLEKLMYGFEGFAAESYVDSFRKKAYPALRARIEGGLTAGRVPYGYRSAGPDGPVQRVPEEVEWLRKGLVWRCAWCWGWTRMAEQARAMGWRTREGAPWSPTAMSRLYSNPFYAGFIRWGEVWVRGRHEPVWSPEEWARLSEVNSRMRGHAAPRGREHEFSGLCVCGVCGCGMSYMTASGLRYLACYPGLRQSAYRHGHERHTNLVREDRLRQIVIARVQEALNDVEAFIAMRTQAVQSSARQDAAALVAALQQVERARQRWERAYEEEAIDLAQLKAHYAELEARQQELQRQLAQARAQEAAEAAARAALRDLAAGQAELDRLLAMLPELDPLERRRIWLALVRRIVLVRGEEPVVEWR